MALHAPLHIPVLLPEVLAAFGAEAGHLRGKWVLDGTFGGGGHTAALLAAGARVVATDWDEAAIIGGRLRFATQLAAGQLELHHAPYNELGDLLGSRRAAGVLLDLGFSSDQLEDPKRGLSYHSAPEVASPLDMRLNSALAITAADILNDWHEARLADLFYTHAEEHRSRPLAKAIVAARKLKPFATTADFLRVIETLYPPRMGLKRAHPAARLFQALRVAVNDELTVLEAALHACMGALEKRGVLAVITFQPSEERLVKKIFRAVCVDTLDSVGRVASVAPWRQGKKIMAGDAELALNPRARSAILRTLTKVA